jgi:predicted Rossmann fold flavoprotein
MALMKTGICIIGAGPAGLMAAIHAAQGAATVVIEANAKPGRKLLLTGGGRCNFTHAGKPQEIARAFGKAGRFLRYSLYELPPDAVMAFFRERGLATRVEPDGCVFPVSDKARDVLEVLLQQADALGVRFALEQPVIDLKADDAGFTVRTKDRRISAARVIVATGGVSWPQTGSTGDGYRLAANLGHTIIPPKPALVSLVAQENWVGELAGISLADIRISAVVEGREVSTTGNMLFTQNGIGGPAALDLSRLLADELFESSDGIPASIGMAANLDEAESDRRLRETIQEHPKKTVANVLAESLPRQLSHVVCRLAECDCDLQVGQLPAPMRKRIISLIKGLPLRITGTQPIAKATVTRGGVSLEQIDPKTMESRIRPGLFFAGEVIDVDGPCGGYNLQACWSTGALAGRSAARSVPGARPMADTKSPE